MQANLDRWIGQMSQPDGRPSKDVARTTTLQTQSGLKVTVIDLPGTYIAEVAPGSAERFNKPGFRLRAAVVETPKGTTSSSSSDRRKRSRSGATASRRS